jgi:hypothetical protein
MYYDLILLVIYYIRSGLALPSPSARCSTLQLMGLFFTEVTNQFFAQLEVSPSENGISSKEFPNEGSLISGSDLDLLFKSIFPFINDSWWQVFFFFEVFITLIFNFLLKIRALSCANIVMLLPLFVNNAILRGNSFLFILAIIV